MQRRSEAGVGGVSSVGREQNVHWDGRKYFQILSYVEGCACVIMDGKSKVRETEREQ
jgi:hypothetical protein